MLLVPRIHILIVKVGWIMQDLVLAVLSISERENIIATLNDEEGEVQISQLEVDIADLADVLCVGLLGCPLLSPLVQLLTSGALIGGHLEFLAITGCCCLLHF